MSIKKIIENIRIFVDQEVQKGNKLTIFKRNSNPSNYFKKFDIKVELECKHTLWFWGSMKDHSIGDEISCFKCDSKDPHQLNILK